MESLERWWTRKYKLPSNHELFLSRTEFDLLVEYHLDIFEDKPLEAYRQADGEIKFTDSGDNLLDLWEQQVADGEEVDFSLAFGKEGLAKIQAKLAKAQEQKIHMDYNKISSKDLQRIEAAALLQNPGMSPFKKR